MKNQASMPTVEKEKVISILILYITSILIILAGAFFSIFSLVNNISLPVMSSQIPGVIFGIVILFLGVRYLLSVNKLKTKVYNSASKFSWSNFKKGKT